MEKQYGYAIFVSYDEESKHLEEYFVIAKDAMGAAEKVQAFLDSKSALSSLNKEIITSVRLLGQAIL